MSFWEDNRVIVTGGAGFKGKIKSDTSKPDGQPRRRLDTTRAEREFGFKAKMDFEEGLKRTIEWYKKYINKFTNKYE